MRAASKVKEYQSELGKWYSLDFTFAVWISECSLKDLWVGFRRLDRCKLMVGIKRVGGQSFYLLIKIASLASYWSRTECHRIVYCAMPRVYIVDIDRQTATLLWRSAISHSSHGWLMIMDKCVISYVYFARERDQGNLQISLTNDRIHLDSINQEIQLSLLIRS